MSPLDANSADSSPADEKEVTAAAPAETEASTDANPTGSSAVDVEDANQSADLLSVVTDAVKKPDETAADPSAVEGEGEAEAEAEAAAAEKGEGESEEEADAKLPFHNHPRWKEVIAERDGFREDAGRFREVESFMQTHGLNSEEVSEGFAVMAKLKSGDPEKLADVREYFASRLALLDDHLGNALPEDLQARVENGEIDEGAAQELAKLRASEKLRSEQAKARETAEAEDRQRSERIATATAMATAVDDWEKRQKQADPDYPKKAALVETTCRAIVQRTGKPPMNAAEAVALVEKALGEVNDAFKGALPPRRQVRADPQGSSTPTVNEPETLKEAIRAAVTS